MRLPLIKDILRTQRVKEESIVEQEQGGRWTLSVYKTEAAAALKLKNRLKRLRLKQVRVAYQAVATKDWQTLWKKDYKPFTLTKHFDVVPFGYRKTYRLKKRTPVFIDTSYAFGTGLHATTKFMAGFIDGLQGKFESFMDIGTGTGILSILAFRCGARDIFALDLRRDIIAIARENFKENKVPSQGLRAVHFGNLHLKKKFDFVAANLITQDLILFKKKILTFVKPGGYLALSGISLKNYPSLREGFSGLPLRCLKIKRGEGWVGLLFKRFQK